MTTSQTTGDQGETETLFVGTFLHSTHRAFAEEIGADIYHLFGRDYREWDEVAGSTAARLGHYVRRAFDIPTGYDYYVLEGGLPLLPGALFSLRDRSARVILLNADETYVNVVESLDHYGPYDAFVHRLASRRLDGAICVGEFVDDYMRRAGVSVPSEIVYPGIDPDLYERLGEVDPDIGSKRVVVVAHGRDHPRRTGGSSAGFDILVDAIPALRREHPGAELHIAGEGHPAEWDDREGVHLHGWVDDLAAFFACGEVSCHPGRGECFPVSTLEPMRGGSPCIVSDRVGTRTVVKEVSESLVCEATVESAAGALSDHLDRPTSEREALSRAARDAVEGFERDRVVAEFGRKYRALVKRL